MIPNPDVSRQKTQEDYKLSINADNHLFRRVFDDKSIFHRSTFYDIDVE